MHRTVVERRLSGEGVLELTLPFGAEEAGRDVWVTIEPVGPKRQITPEEWRTGILATAGCWQGQFERPPQGDFEEREPLS
jgi:hypothetical protein